MDKASEYLRRVAKQTDNTLARAVAAEREFIREATRTSHAPYALTGKGLSPPATRPEGLSGTLGALRALSRAVKDAARVETPFLRAFGARFGYLLEYSMPASEGKAAPSNAPKTPQPKQQATPVQSKGDGPPSERRDSRVETRPNEKQSPRKRNRSPAATANTEDRAAPSAVSEVVIARRRPPPRTPWSTRASAMDGFPSGWPARIQRVPCAIGVRTVTSVWGRTCRGMCVGHARIWLTNVTCRAVRQDVRGPMCVIGPGFVQTGPPSKLGRAAAFE